jgi:hypothetical protein
MGPPCKDLQESNILEESKEDQGLLISFERKFKAAQPVTKVRDIDYFRKVKRFFECAERGQQKDEKRMLYELKNDIKKHMWNKSDPLHLINLKNIFG